MQWLQKSSSFALAWIFFLLIFSGCAQKFQYAHLDANLTISNDLQALSQRHLEYYEAFSNKNYKKTFEYELPYQQFIHPYPWYENFFSSSVKGFDIVQNKIKRQGNFGLVTMTVKTQSGNLLSYRDAWFNVDGNWYHRFKDSKFPETGNYWEEPDY